MAFRGCEGQQARVVNKAICLSTVEMTALSYFFIFHACSGWRKTGVTFLALSIESICYCNVLCHGPMCVVSQCGSEWLWDIEINANQYQSSRAQLNSTQLHIERSRWNNTFDPFRIHRPNITTAKWCKWCPSPPLSLVKDQNDLPISYRLYMKKITHATDKKTRMIERLIYIYIYINCRAFSLRGLRNWFSWTIDRAFSIYI